jgi:hypothetical protein
VGRVRNVDEYSGEFKGFDETLATRVSQLCDLAQHLDREFETKVSAIKCQYGESELGKMLMRMAAAPDLYRYGERFPQVARQALFLITYGYVEADINLLVSNFVEPDHDIKVRDLADRGLKGISTYLRKVSRVEMPCGIFGTGEFQLISDLRNRMAHERGFARGRYLSKIQSGLPEFLELQARVQLGEHGEIQITNDLLPYLVKRATEIYRELWKQIVEKGYIGHAEVEEES